MKKLSTVHFTPSGSPKSTLSSIDDKLIDRNVDDSPFDEPPLPEARFDTSENCRLNGYSLYGVVVENHNKSNLHTMSEKLESIASSICSSYRFDDDDGSSVTFESRDENLDASSLFSSILIGDDESFNAISFRRNRSCPCEYHVCDGGGRDFNALCGFPMSSFQSKPLSKPKVWKGYTCFRGACPVASMATLSCEEDKFENWHCQRTDVDLQPCNDTLPSDGSSISALVEDAARAQYFFRTESVQEHLEFVKVFAHHFLKKKIFVQDPDFSISNDNVDDFDSIVCSLT